MKFIISTILAGLCLAMAKPAVAQDVASLYRSKCAVCHSADGKGDTPANKKLGTRDFRSAESAKKSETELLNIVKNGAGKMAGYAGKISDADIRELVRYIRLLAAGKQPTSNGEVVVPTKEFVTSAVAAMTPAERDDMEASARVLRGNDLLGKGDLDGAIQDLNLAIRLNPNDAGAHTILGKALLQKGDPEGAAREYGEAIRLQPSVVSHYEQRGYCYLQLKSWILAFKDFNRIVELDPDLAQGYAGRADVYYFSRVYAKAIADYSSYLLRVSQPSSLAYFRRGESYYMLENYTHAIADYQQAAELDPNSVPAYNGLAWTMATAPADGVRNGAKAIQYAKKALQLATAEQQYNYMDTLAAAYAEAGRFDDAIAQQSKAISQLPKGLDVSTAEGMSNRLHLYQQHQPYRERPQ